MPPPVASDGTAACELCSSCFPLAALTITAHGYACDPCSTRTALAVNAPVDVETVKVGRGRSWLMPLIIAVGAAITIVAPAAVFIGTWVVAAILLWLYLRRGL